MNTNLSLTNLRNGEQYVPKMQSNISSDLNNNKFSTSFMNLNSYLSGSKQQKKNFSWLRGRFLALPPIKYTPIVKNKSIEKDDLIS